MMAALEDIINRAIRLPGLAAWAADLPDAQPLGQCLADWIWLDQVRSLVGEIKTAFPLLRAHGIEPASICWVHERARIYAVLNPNGACLVLVVENRSGLLLNAFEDLMQQFATVVPPPGVTA